MLKEILKNLKDNFFINKLTNNQTLKQKKRVYLVPTMKKLLPTTKKFSPQKFI